MTPQDLAQYRAQLLQERQSLLDRMAQQRDGATSRIEAAVAHFARTEDSTAQVNTARDLELALTEHEAAEMQAIDEAISRLEAGSYGVCQDCGEHITPARLAAQPIARRCTACQSAAEKNAH